MTASTPALDVAAIQRTAHAIRRRVLAHTLSNNGGYLSQACSAAELLTTLYGHLLNLGPSEAPLVPPPFSGVPGPNNPNPTSGAAYNGPRGPKLDRLFFSPVHYSLVLYSVLIEMGRLSEDGLEHFNRDGSTVEMIGAEHSPGIEVTAGSLAQTLSQAMGVALARKLRGESGQVWVFMTDGEFQEGQTWEAFAALSYHNIDNVRVMVDVNGQQCDGPMSAVMSVEPLADRLRSFGAQVVELDGHDIEGLIAAGTQETNGGPLVILGRTDPCRGLPIMRERAPNLHYVRFKTEAERARYAEVLANFGSGS